MVVRQTSNSPTKPNRCHLPLVGNSQPVMRGPFAEAAGGITEGDDGVPVEGSSATPPTVTTTAPPAGVPAGPAADASCAKPTPAPTRSPPPSLHPFAKPVAPAPVAKPAPAAKPVEKPAGLPKPLPLLPAAAGTPVSRLAITWCRSSAPAPKPTPRAFVKEQGGEYRYFKKVLNGKPLYVITYGSFPSRAAAVTAIKALPAKVQAGKPWPRTVASVQQELAATR